MDREEKIKALDAAISQIEKQYGKGAVMKLGDSSANMNVEAIPTGSLSLDLALGICGIPKGRIVEIYGPESSGKTTVTLHMIAEVQKRGGIAGFIDAEHALDPAYAKNIGVDIDNLYISQPDCGEQALEITETMVRKIRCYRYSCSRLCCGSCSQAGDRRRHGRCGNGSSGQTYESGHEEAYSCYQQDQLYRNLYQPA